MSWHHQPSSSSEEDREDVRRYSHGGSPPTPHRSPFTRIKRIGTPLTVTSMTPSPMRSPLISDMFPTRSASFSNVQHGYLNPSSVSAVLFQDSSPKRRRKRFSRRSRLSGQLHLEDMPHTPLAKPPLIGTRRRSSARKKRGQLDTSDTSPETSPSERGRNLDFHDRYSTPFDVKFNHHWFLQMALLCMVILSSACMIWLTDSAVPSGDYELTRPEVHSIESGLRGKMVQGHWKESSEHHGAKKHAIPKTTRKKYQHKETSSKEEHYSSKKSKKTQQKRQTGLLSVQLPSPMDHEQAFEILDRALYGKVSTNKRRVVDIDPTMPLPTQRQIQLYPADFTDSTQLYPILDSDDERLSHMEIKEPYSTDECVPMQDWQTTFHPSCNEMHELPLSTLGAGDDMDFNLFGTKGFWRNAWKVDFQDNQNTVVLKTLKFEHRFEDAHFEHDRVDAAAMERLTSSEHVINIFGFCGHSVMTEYADGTRLGALADKSKKKPLKRLEIARDIANGLADVHGIDGDGNATFVHLDINPANVVSIGGTLKLNDFNIGIIRQWNVTSNKPCGFPSQYPNPQWRSPEEARGEQYLTEKVDIFSMGHIFFRMICGHEPWNKLEPGGRPPKEVVNESVKKGVLPFIPESVMESDDPEVIAIRDAMLSCYTFDPQQRPSARKISLKLDKVLQKLREQSNSVK